MKRDHPLVIFGNFVNELMVSVPVPRHGAALVAVSPRKIWLTQPNDVLVIGRSMSERLRDYACDLLGFELGAAADTLAFDGKWRYLVLATSHDRANELETALAGALKLA